MKSEFDILPVVFILIPYKFRRLIFISPNKFIHYPEDLREKDQKAFTFNAQKQKSLR